LDQEPENDEIVAFAKAPAQLLRLAGMGSPHFRPKWLDEFKLVAKRHDGFSKFMEVLRARGLPIAAESGDARVDRTVREPLRRRRKSCFQAAGRRAGQSPSQTGMQALAGL